MKRCILVLFVVLSVFLTGCGTKQNATVSQTEKSPEVVINMPTDDTVNGYRTKSKPSQKTVQGTEKVYYANKNTKKFHLKSCPSSTKIKEENLYISGDRAELVSEGYSPCANCKP